MLGLLTVARLTLARPRVPMAKVTVSLMTALRRRRERLVEREYRRAAARGHLPREFGAPFYREVPPRRWNR